MTKYKRKARFADCIQFSHATKQDILALLGFNASSYGEDYIMVRHEKGVSTLRLSDWVVIGEDLRTRVYTDREFHTKYEQCNSI